MYVELKYLLMAAKRGKVKARDSICISSRSTAFYFPPAKQDYLITHPLITLPDYVFFFCPDSSHSTSSALPCRHLALCLSLSLLLKAGGVTCQLTLPQAEEFIPESGTRPYWGKVRGLGGNHPMWVCVPFVYTVLLLVCLGEEEGINKWEQKQQ